MHAGNVEGASTGMLTTPVRELFLPVSFLFAVQSHLEVGSFVPVASSTGSSLPAAPSLCRYGYFLVVPHLLSYPTDAARIRLCGVCRLSGHDLRLCPIVTNPDLFCGCAQRVCCSCSAACSVCGETGHGPDTLKEKVRAGIVPKWVCDEHDIKDMQARLADVVKRLPPTHRMQKEAARGQKRSLLAIVPTDGNRFQAHDEQSEIVDLTGLGGASAPPAVRLATDVSAALEDEGISRPVARNRGAFAGDSAAQPAGGSSQPIPGAMGTVDTVGRRENVVAALEEQLRKQPK